MHIWINRMLRACWVKPNLTSLKGLCLNRRGKLILARPWDVLERNKFFFESLWGRNKSIAKSELRKRRLVVHNKGSLTLILARAHTLCSGRVESLDYWGSKAFASWVIKRGIVLKGSSELVLLQVSCLFELLAERTFEQMAAHGLPFLSIVNGVCFHI